MRRVISRSRSVSCLAQYSVPAPRWSSARRAELWWQIALRARRSRRETAYTFSSTLIR